MKSTAFGVALGLAAMTSWATPAASAPTNVPTVPTVTETRRPDPLNPQAQVPAGLYRSAFEGYRPSAETAVGAWPDANKAVQQAGGWRAYAREAAAPQPAGPAAASAPPAPAQPSRQGGGHHHH